MVWRCSSPFILVIAFLLFGSRSCCSLTPDGSSNTTGKQEKGRDETGLPIKHHVKRGVGDELNTLKDKAKKASSAYRWIKENWQKLFIIIVSLIALIAAVGIYRRCLSDSGSGGDDEEPNIVVVRMLKHDIKGNAACLDPVLEGEITQENCSSGKKLIASNGCATGTSHKRDPQNTQEMATGGRPRDRKTSVTTMQHCQIKISYTSPTGTDLRLLPSRFQAVRLADFHMNNIPISGYSSFQQIEFSLIYFYVIHYVLEVTKADQRWAQLTRISRGSTCKGPFPVYEQIPLINILIAALIEKYRDDYIPTANTNINLPLTISP